MHIDPLSVVGAFPLGDPNLIRARASEVRGHAERLREVAATMESRSVSTRFEGPAANRFRADVGGLTARGRRDVDTLHALADYLLRSAGRLEFAQADWRHRLKQVEAEIASRGRHP